ncbi:MAG: hypothetical protein JWO69_471 [Thermoleophilia bacterium]|jgi:hypothetical protein|nr:hypothetical protein [Thermoleophilia bacterium]
MKNVLLKFAGLFVEKVPVDQQGKRLAPNVPGPSNAPAPQPGQQPGSAPMVTGQQVPQQMQPMQQHPGAPQQGGVGQSPAVPPSAPGAPTVSVALRAWVPQEYAAHLAPFGLHVIAAGGAVTSEQARGWGADVLIISAECLGQDIQLLQQPQLPTVFITPQPVMLPDVAGVVQAQEPLRASDVAHAVREAVTAFGAARR